MKRPIEVRWKLGIRMLATVLIAASGSSSDIQAQAVLNLTAGVVEADGHHLAYHDVQLVDATGTVVAHRVTDADGRFLARLPAGEYRLVVTRVGAEDWTSEPFRLGPDQRDFEFTLPLAPVLLEPVVVTAGAECEVGPGMARAYELLEELVPAFREIALTETSEHSRFVVEVTRPKRSWHQRSWQFFHAWSVDTVVVERPVAGPQLDESERLSFATPVDDTTNLYQPPDAVLLGSERFWTSYCFDLSERGDSIVRFWPKALGENVNVRGEITTAHWNGRLIPTRVDFHFTNLDSFVTEFERPFLELQLRERYGEAYYSVKIAKVAVEEEDLTGFLEFGRDPEGRVFTATWEVNRPLLFYQASYGAKEGARVWPRTVPLPTSARVLALHWDSG